MQSEQGYPCILRPHCEHKPSSRSHLINRHRHFRDTLLPLVILLSIVSPLWPQTNRVQDHLDSTYTGKRLLLRNFYVGDDLRYDGNGILRAGKDAPGPWTLAGVEIKHIGVSAQGVEIRGDRLGIRFDGEKQNFVKVGKFRIHVSKPISNEDVETAFDGAFEKIFIKFGEEDLRPLLPAHWKICLSGNDPESRQAAWEAALLGSKVPSRKMADFPGRAAYATKGFL